MTNSLDISIRNFNILCLRTCKSDSCYRVAAFSRINKCILKQFRPIIMKIENSQKPSDNTSFSKIPYNRYRDISFFL